MIGKIERVTVAVNTDGVKQIAWSVSKDMPASVEFHVDVARSVTGTWEDISGPLTNTCFFEDSVKRTTGYDYGIYYRVRRIGPGEEDLETSESMQVGAAFTKRKDWLIAREIIRREQLDMDQYGGIPGLFYKRKVWGTPCTICLDHDIKSATDSHCPECFGTGIQGGYYEPFALNVKSIQARDQTTEVVDTQGTFQSPDWTVRLILAPEINSQDVWVNTKTNERYIVSAIKPVVDYLGVPLIGQALFRLAEQSSAVYSVGVTPSAEDALNDAMVTYTPQSGPEIY